jgi:hypothetical protein
LSPDRATPSRSPCPSSFSLLLLVLLLVGQAGATTRFLRALQGPLVPIPSPFGHANQACDLQAPNHPSRAILRPGRSPSFLPRCSRGGRARGDPVGNALLLGRLKGGGNTHASAFHRERDRRAARGGTDEPARGGVCSRVSGVDSVTNYPLTSKLRRTATFLLSVWDSGKPCFRQPEPQGGGETKGPMVSGRLYR